MINCCRMLSDKQRESLHTPATAQHMPAGWFAIHATSYNVLVLLATARQFLAVWTTKHAQSYNVIFLPATAWQLPVDWSILDTLSKSASFIQRPHGCRPRTVY